MIELANENLHPRLQGLVFGICFQDRIDVGDNMVETEFGYGEVKMSTYLVCFVVCDFDHVESETSTGVRVSMIANLRVLGC